MIQAVTVFAILAAPAIGIAVLLYVTIRSLLDFSRAKSERVYIALKALASLAAWVLASCSWLYIFFLMAYRTGPFVDIEGEWGRPCRSSFWIYFML
jgi:hypothetical protein